MRKINLVLLIMASCLLSSCKDANHEKNAYSQVQNGMSYAQVVKILDKPTHVNKLLIDGVSSTSAAWHKKDGIIMIEFLDDKVEIKTINNIGSVDVDNT